MLDSLLTQCYDDLLAPLDARCARGEQLDYAWFRDLDEDAWTILLSREYSSYPALRAALPDLPSAEVQETWNGRSGLALAAQTVVFYRKLRELAARHGARPLADSAVLDFGCGWGRLLRFVARDVDVLCGCDPYPGILGVCEQTRVPGDVQPIAYVADALPFERAFDLVYAFSVFTHLSEESQLAALRAIHAGLAPAGLLVATIRPPAYVRDGMHPSLPRAGKAKRLERPTPEYLFVAHDVQPSGGAETFGETVVNLPYMRERWGEWFELVEVSLMLEDPYQVVVTLRGR